MNDEISNEAAGEPASDQSENNAAKSLTFRKTAESPDLVRITQRETDRLVLPAYKTEGTITGLASGDRVQILVDVTGGSAQIAVTGGVPQIISVPMAEGDAQNSLTTSVQVL